jgi:lipopolysaccharide transport system permease protein
VRIASKPMAAVRSETPTVYLRPPQGWIPLNLIDLWNYRELVYFLTWRDIKVRYKQASLGIAWAIIQPIMTMVIFTYIFGDRLGLSPDSGISQQLYPIFTFAGLLPWHLFQNSLQRSSTSLVTNSNLLTKIYFPRLIIPLSAVLSGVVDFLFSVVVLAGLMVIFQVPISLRILWLIPLTLLVVAASLAVGLWLSALNVQYRDVQQAVPFIIQAWMWLSPVVYSVDTVATSPMARLVYSLNPMAGVIQGFRWALLNGSPPNAMMAVSIGVVIVLLISGLYYFRRMERTFADMV